MSSRTSNQDTTTDRRILAAARDVRHAVVDIARSAKRSITIFSQDLEPESYDGIEFIDTIKNLILTHKFARIRILVKDPIRSVKEGHRLVELARRFSSFIEVRVIHSDYSQRAEAFLIADTAALVFRANASRWDGISDLRNPRIANRYLEFFDSVWEKSAVAQELRALHI